MNSNASLHNECHRSFLRAISCDALDVCLTDHPASSEILDFLLENLFCSPSQPSRIMVSKAPHSARTHEICMIYLRDRLGGGTSCSNNRKKHEQTAIGPLLCALVYKSHRGITCFHDDSPAPITGKSATKPKWGPGFASCVCVQSGYRGSHVHCTAGFDRQFPQVPCHAQLSRRCRPRASTYIATRTRN